VTVKFRFGDCLLDCDARRLVRRGKPSTLPPKAFELLKVLVENRPRAIAKAELVERVWPGVFVADDSVAKAVSRVRKAIGDSDAKPIVRTVHGFGYAFEAQVVETGSDEPRPSAGAVICWMFCADREFPLADGEHIIGREPDASIRLDSPAVSRRHARIVVNGTQATFEDLSSKNGSFVRGVRVIGATALA
jgi:DNA-binding winged helix-turn-helix (wHTH) protein